MSNFKDLTLDEARDECRRIGLNEATGDALRFMYARMVAQRWTVIAESVYRRLQETAVEDVDIIEQSRALLRDFDAAWEAGYQAV